MLLNDIVQDFQKDGTLSDDFKRIVKMYDDIVKQTHGYVVASGFSDVVLGLSGGIDSTIVAKIAVDALGSDHVHGILMPGPFSSDHSVKDSVQLANSLGIATNILHIQNAVTEFESELIASFISSISDLTRQNLQARSRMIFLMAASNDNNWMVLNTGNKSEVYTGYSTLYGDMVGAFAPIGGVFKTDVYKMCCAINMRCGNEIIPNNVILKPPSAELTNGQTDEASLGIDYVTLDKILHLIVDLEYDDSKICRAGFATDDVRLVRSKIKKSEFKRPYEPPCAKV